MSNARQLFARLATPDPALITKLNASKQKDDPKTTYNTCSVTYSLYMHSAFYAMNNGFTQLDAYRSFVYAAQHLSTHHPSSQDPYEHKEPLAPEEIATLRLPSLPFNTALRHAASIYKAAMDGSELMDSEALPLSTQEEADSFAATFAACLPEPVMFAAAGEEEKVQHDPDDPEATTTAAAKKAQKATTKKGDSTKAATAAKTKEKENIVATLHQYINGNQQRLLSSGVLSEMNPYQKGIQQLFVSYMTDDVFTGQPPSWSR